MANKEKAAAKPRSISKRKEKRDLVFAGGNHFLDKPRGEAEAMAQKVRVLVAQALDIPVLMVVTLGGVPYVDNHGRKEKLNQYASGAQFEYEYTQIATDDVMKAIVKCRIMDSKGKPLCGWAIGECSPGTTRMSSLKGYQNHMAQTRAENRAFEAAFGARFRKDLFAGVARILQAEVVGATPAASEQLAVQALKAGNTSAEEAAIDPGIGGGIGFEDPEIKKRRDAYAKALKVIATTRDVATLERAKGNIAVSELYERPQKNELIKLIDGRIKEITAG